MTGNHAKNKDTEHAQKQDGEEKLHGDPLDETGSTSSEHQRGQRSSSRTGGSSRGAERNSARSSGATAEHNSAIPAADNGGHARSAAAHLGGDVHGHTKPTVDQRAIIEAEEFPREPPRDAGRSGKQHRRQ